MRLHTHYDSADSRKRMGSGSVKCAMAARCGIPEQVTGCLLRLEPSPPALSQTLGEGREDGTDGVSEQGEGAAG